MEFIKYRGFEIPQLSSKEELNAVLAGPKLFYAVNKNTGIRIQIPINADLSADQDINSEICDLFEQCIDEVDRQSTSPVGIRTPQQFECKCRMIVVDKAEGTYENMDLIEKEEVGDTTEVTDSNEKVYKLTHSQLSEFAELYYKKFNQWQNVPPQKAVDELIDIVTRKDVITPDTFTFEDLVSQLQYFIREGIHYNKYKNTVEIGPIMFLIDTLGTVYCATHTSFYIEEYRDHPRSYTISGIRKIFSFEYNGHDYKGLTVTITDHENSGTVVRDGKDSVMDYIRCRYIKGNLLPESMENCIQTIIDDGSII